MTEEQAKTKWCPASRKGQHVRKESGGHYDREWNCIGAACMAWRWHLEFPTSTVSGGVPVISAGQPSTTRGYCGLAGQPS